MNRNDGDRTERRPSTTNNSGPALRCAPSARTARPRPRTRLRWFHRRLQMARTHALPLRTPPTTGCADRRRPAAGRTTAAPRQMETRAPGLRPAPSEPEPRRCRRLTCHRQQLVFPIPCWASTSAKVDSPACAACNQTVEQAPRSRSSNTLSRCVDRGFQDGAVHDADHLVLCGSPAVPRRPSIERPTHIVKLAFRFCRYQPWIAPGGGSRWTWGGSRWTG